MKTSKLLSLATGLALLSSTTFAGTTTTGNHTNDTTHYFADLDYPDWDYTSNPLNEVLEMDNIPEIFISKNSLETQVINNTNFDQSEEEYINPLEEVLQMEEIPSIDLSVNNTVLGEKAFFLDNADQMVTEELYVNPLVEVLEMEAIPTINLAIDNKDLDYKEFSAQK